MSMGHIDVHQDYLEHLDAEIQSSADDRFVIDSDDKAEWALRKIAQAKHAIEERGQYVKREVERLTRWQESRDESDQGTIDYMTSLLKDYYEHLRSSGVLGKTKTYSLPSGKLQMRAAQPEYVRDNAKLIEWARQTGALRVKEEPDWATIRKRIRPVKDQSGAEVVDTETGDIVPGVLVRVPSQEAFSVRVGDE